ncbi:MAG TPA: exodeoxyribonuclease III, partial [Thermoanaerobaculia bacterium]|jgi:exodeoxyribonuclease-3|nr:exodeoxyribonuclease III [Thermoanaerobaculia bacterium]
MAFTLATWNVNGIRARQEQFLEWVGRDRPDVVCLQEIKAKPDQLPETVCNLDGYWCYWHGAGGYSGVSLQLRREAFPEEPKFSHPSFDLETRVVVAEAGDLVVASIYVPNGGKDFPAKMDFLRDLARWAGELRDSGRRVVLAGDMNVTRTDRDVHPKERKPFVIGQRPEEREAFEAILAHGLVDVGRAQDPDNDNLFTWWAPWRNMRQRNIGWRIDYILASDALAASATSCKVFPEIGTSDHAPVVAQFGV